jgi:hypothetical protein
MRCPVCRAEVDHRPQCRRCRADLSLLVALEEQRQGALREANQALAAGDGPQLLAAASRAHLLRQDEESARLVALAYLLCRDFASAWQVYRSRQPV